MQTVDFEKIAYTKLVVPVKKK